LHKLGTHSGHWVLESVVSTLNRVATALKKHRPLVIESAERRAAVALLLRERGEALEILVIKRAEKADDPWSGHMALPGGGWEPGDKDVYDTARRETLEEIGVDLDEGRLLGRLDDMGPRSAGRELVVSTVVVAFWVPVDRLVDEHVEIPDFPGEWPAFTYKDRYVIWGLTHRILTQLWALVST
jgi:8-oxo-dGTP pyrophosphatase MutT (NUDIX family)